MAEKIARYYIPPESPQLGYGFDGVPNRDLTKEEYDGLKDGQKADVDASDLYQKSAPRGAKAERRAELEAPEEEAQPVEDGDTDG